MLEPAGLIHHPSPEAGEWVIITATDIAFGHPVQVGRAMFPDHEWPFTPDTCTWSRGEWYLDGAVRICMGCGCDGT